MRVASSAPHPTRCTHWAMLHAHMHVSRCCGAMRCASRLSRTTAHLGPSCSLGGCGSSQEQQSPLWGCLSSSNSSAALMRAANRRAQAMLRGAPAHLVQTRLQHRGLASRRGASVSTGWALRQRGLGTLVAHARVIGEVDGLSVGRGMGGGVGGGIGGIGGGIREESCTSEALSGAKMPVDTQRHPDRCCAYHERGTRGCACR